jgi:hypothetical protein
VFARRLSKVTFEQDSRIARMAASVFDGCSSLRSIDIPAGLREISGLAMADSGIGSVTVDSGNQFLRMSGDFLVDFRGVSLLRYFGHEARHGHFREGTENCFGLRVPAFGRMSIGSPIRMSCYRAT